MDVVQFVDSISASPTVRLDLNDDVAWGLSYDGTDFSPPDLRRAVAQTLLTDGGQVAAAAYDNRMLRLRLELKDTTVDTVASRIQTLNRELDRPTNLLKWQPGTSAPVFFRTMRSPVNRVTELPGAGTLKLVDVDVLAEPFAYGLKETLGQAMNANSTFEAGISPWTGQNGAVAQSSTFARTGTFSLRFTPTGGVSPAGPRSELMPVTAGVPYVATVWVYSTAGYAAGCSAALDWYDAVGSFISSSLGTTSALPAGAVTQYQTAAVAPAGAAQVQFRARMAGTPAASDVVYVDDATLAQYLTVTNNPAAGSNGMFLDITGVKGDVETPLKITIPYSGTAQTWMFAVRRRGTPSSAPFVLQAESMTQGTDTSTQPNDAAMSGAGNNYSRTTFATNAAMAQRLSTSWPPPGVDLRGRYRVFVLARRSSGTGVINAKLGWGPKGSSPTAFGSPVSPANTNPAFFDLGLVSYPGGADPVTDGYSGSALPVLDQNVAVWAERVSGTSTIDFDYLLFVPADDRLVFITRPIGITDYVATANGEKFVVDGTTEKLYALWGTGEIYGGWAGSTTSGKVVGGWPAVSPGVTNRLYVVQTGVPVSPTTTASVTVEYWPRYLYARPPSS